ncbi:MAG: phosphatase [Nitrosomonadaceae bacterium]|nr:phosphatase [Nitrosomonadaceae bacterium]|tara:strand:+ start:498 stop:1280 length:783 start_codon:yes stop_codon:yes gene_type:complete
MKNNKISAVLFDVDGTIAETEHNGHRLAFNAAFKDFSLSWDWNTKLYSELLDITGGKERIRYYIEKYAPDKLKTSELDAWITHVHITKTKYFLSLLNRGLIPPRPGIIRLIKELRSAKIDIAIASTTTLKNVTTLLQSTLGKNCLSWFNVIAAGDVVPQKKPAPDIYIWALKHLGLQAQQCIAIEDSECGLRAALAAGLTTIVTVNNYTEKQDFTGASLVLSDLGEPSEPFTIISGTSHNNKLVNIEMLNKIAFHNDKLT